MTVRLIGMTNALAKLARVGVVLSPQGAAVKRSLGLIGQQIVEVAQGQVPVLTGATKATIEINDEGVGAGGAAFYLEFGTSFMPAQPFMRPAIDSADAAVPAAATVLRTAITGGL